MLFSILLQFHADEFTPQNKERHMEYLPLIEADTRGGTHSTTYGINGCSPLIPLVGFAVTQCLPFDVMHVVYEAHVQ